MLNDADASGFKKVYLAMGFTDLRRGIDGLATIVRFQFKLDPYDKNTLFLFCGRRSDRIKALLWEGDGFLLMYKRLDNGAFRWPRSANEAMSITKDQYRKLLYDYHVIQADETPVLVNKDGRSAGSKSYMWVYRSGFMYPERQIILYEYQKTRNASHPRNFLSE